jgi:hypothetical protein
MTPDSAIAAAQRTEAARHLMAQAQTGFVDLVTVTGLELCVLGGPRHPLFEEAVARAWMDLGNRQRRKLIEWVTEGMAERGLLIGSGPQPGDRKDGAGFALKPELGLALAARCRPAFIVVTETAVQNLRTPRFFALGDETGPVRGIVVEEPAALPPDMASRFPYVKKFGPLGRFYRYVLVSPDKAAEALAELTISPPSAPAASGAAGWAVSLYHHDDGTGTIGQRLTVRGDGTTATVAGAGDGNGNRRGYDLNGLQAVMRDLVTVRPR